MREAKKLLGLIVIAVGARPLAAGDWPHWRGPTRDGKVAEDSGWTAGAWPVKAPAWTARVGEGCSSPLVAAGRVYALGWSGGRDTLRCLDAVTGKELWTARYSCPEYGRFHTGDEGVYSGPSSTPEYDPATGLIYTLSIDGDLNCWDTRHDGKKVWGLNLYERFGAKRRPKVGRAGLRDYGYTSSPLVHGDRLLVEVGAPTGNLIAFDKRTGAKVWASACTDQAGHTGGPALATVEGVPCGVVLTLYRLLVVRLDPGHEGQTAAEYPWVTDFANSIASPAVHEDCVLITSAYNQSKICKLRLTLRGAKKVWERPYPSKVCTPVVHQGHVYWAWQKLHCLDWEKGTLKWAGGIFGDPGSCVLTADGRLVAFGLSGKLVLAETAERSPKKYTELAARDRVVQDLAWPHVVLAGGRLYCKDRQGFLVCFSVRK